MAKVRPPPESRLTWRHTETGWVCRSKQYNIRIEHDEAGYWRYVIDDRERQQEGIAVATSPPFATSDDAKQAAWLVVRPQPGSSRVHWRGWVNQAKLY